MFRFVKKGGETICAPLWTGYLDWEDKSSDVPLDAKDLVAEMLQVDVTKRPDIAEVCNRLERVVMMHELQEAIQNKKEEMQEIIGKLSSDMKGWVSGESIYPGAKEGGFSRETSKIFDRAQVVFFFAVDHCALDEML